MLTVEAYDASEKRGRDLTPNRIIEASRSDLFGHVGYPTRADSEIGLRRFVDVMHDGRTQATFDALLGGAITDEEFDLLRRATRAVATLTETRYGRRMIATASLLRALAVVRQIAIVCPARGARIFEIGPGSGYVGALLALAGYGYAATENAQGFYVYQSNLLETIAADRFVELATDGTAPQDLPARSVAHIPWWKFMRPEPPSIGADLVTCNHALAEMHPNALSYALRLTHRSLAASGGCFLFEGFGSTLLRSQSDVMKKFEEAGFALAHTDALATVYSTDRTGAVAARLLEGRLGVKGTTTLSDVERMWREFLPAPDLLTDDERFRLFIGNLPR